MEAKSLYLFLFSIISICIRQSQALPASAQGVQQLQQFPGQEAYMESVQRVAAKSTLNYNDTCSFPDEKRRLELGKKMLDMLSKMDFNQMSTITSGMNSLADAPGKYCNAIKSLECKSHGTCGCASGESMGVSMQTHWEENQCRLTLGSLCVPEDTQASLQAMGIKLPTPDLRCERNSKCLIKGSYDQKCTTEKMQEKMLDEYGGPEAVRNDPMGFMRFTTKMASEGICVCSGVADMGSWTFAMLLLLFVSLLNFSLA